MTIKDTEEQVVRVVAPSNLNEGYVFQVTTSDGRFVSVKAPAGGVEEGQVFDANVLDVEAPPVAEAVAVAAEPEAEVDLSMQDPVPSATAEPEFTVPTGAWRHGLFSCFDACSSGNFWMPFCFGCIALGQLLQRMKLNFVGSESGESYKHSCAIWTIITFVVVILTFLPWSIQSSSILIAIEVVIIILAIIALTQARYYMRRKYSIPADCCADSGFLSDCCCMSWCTCCGIIQMLRHTHDEKEFAYDYTSPTGLHSDAPEIV